MKKKLLGIITLVAMFTMAVCPESKAEPPALTGMVSITGIPWIGQTLTADINSLSGSGTITYRGGHRNDRRHV
jgi:ABC-type proline/glycine betaine transport system substrate-binding protein